MLTRDSFAALLAAGLTSVIGIQTLVILGGTLKLIPLTGVTLPLLSYGGSSVLANFVLLGLLLAISAEPTRLDRAR
jgi:cell division protein FtsW